MATRSSPTWTFSPANAAEHAYEIIADGGVIFGSDVAKKSTIAPSVGGNVDVAEEDNHVSSRFTIDVHVAEEADRIVDGGIGGDIDI